MQRLGCLFLAHHEGQLDEYRTQLGRSRLLGYNYELLSPSEACALHPLMEPGGVVGALYDPGYGHVDPAGLTNALANAARAAGAGVMRHTPVTGLSPRPDGTWDVETPNQTYHAHSVVNAAGFWAREVAAMAGVRLPVIGIEHQYIVTDDIAEVSALETTFPAMRGGDASYYMRREGQGFLVGAWESSPRTWGMDGVPENFGAELLPPNVERIESELLAAGTRIPVVAEAGIKRIINGPIAFGPDAKPHLGPHRGVRNFYAAAGLSGGIAQAGGAGRCLAELIVQGSSSIDLTTLDADRFGAYATTDYTAAKVRECYALRFAVGYPEEERPAGRPAKLSPLYGRLKSARGVYGALRGWERPMWFAPEGVEAIDKPSFHRPNWFTHVGDECRKVAATAGVLDLTSFAKYKVSGAGAERWLNRLLAKPVPARVGRVGLRLLLSHGGGVIGDLTVARLTDDSFYLIGAAAAEHYHTRWLESFLPAAGVRFEPVGPQYGVLALAGPRSRDILRQVTNGDVSNEGLPFFGAREIDIDGVTVLALRVAFTGELGLELHVPIDHLGSINDTLWSAGQEYGLGNFGMRAMNNMRIEESYRRLGSDLTLETSPLEAGMDGFIGFDHRGFIGCDSLNRLRDEGVTRTLVTLKVDAKDADAIGNEPVYFDGRIVGYVSSGGYGHRVGESIALAYVPTDIGGDAALEVEILNDRRPALIVEGSRYDPSGTKLRL